MVNYIQIPILLDALVPMKNPMRIHGIHCRLYSIEKLVERVSKVSNAICRCLWANVKNHTQNQCTYIVKCTRSEWNVIAVVLCAVIIEILLLPVNVFILISQSSRKLDKWKKKESQNEEEEEDVVIEIIVVSLGKTKRKIEKINNEIPRRNREQCKFYEHGKVQRFHFSLFLLRRFVAIDKSEQ